MDAKERYALIKLAREQFELGQKLLAQAGCKLVVNTFTDAGCVDVVPACVEFVDRGELGEGGESLVESAMFIAEAPLALFITAHYANGEQVAAEVPEWWADVLHEELTDRK